MLKHCSALLFSLALSLSYGQNNLVVLAESGARFTLFVNDQQINDSAQSQVIAKKLLEDSFQIKMVFAAKEIPPFTGPVLLTEAGKSVRKREFTYSLQEEKGKRKLKFISVNDIYSDTAHKVQEPETKIKKVFAEKKQREMEADKLNERYPAPANCQEVVLDTVVAINMLELRNEHIELNRQKDARWFISHHCLKADQLTRLLAVFDREDSKVKIAQFAYDYIADPNNFLTVLHAMKYVTEKEELKKYYQKRTEK